MPSSPSRFSPSRAPRTPRRSCGGCASSWPVPPYTSWPGCAPSWAACAARRRLAQPSGHRSLGLWIQQHLRVVLAHLTPNADASWAPDPKDLEDSIIRAEGRGFTRWQEHYNAACVYSLPLLLDEAHRPGRRESAILASLAVQHLEEATACADSGYVASRRDWVLSDDPDLDGLRAETSFKRYEANFFPSSERTVRRPRELHKWELSSYTFDLLSATAERWEQAWVQRGQKLERTISLSELAGWCEVELEAWKRVRQVAVHHRHWETRVKLIKRMQRWQPVHGFDPIEVGFPCFADSSGWGSEDEPPPDVNAVVESNDRRLAALAGLVDQAEGADRCDSLIADLGNSRIALVRLGAPRRTVPHVEVARLCESHGALWAALGRYLADPGESADGRLAEAVASTEGIWQRIRRSWNEDSGPHEAAA